MAIHYSSKGARNLKFRFYRKYDNFYCYQLLDKDDNLLFKECFRTKEEFAAEHLGVEIDYSKPLYNELYPEEVQDGKC